MANQRQNKNDQLSFFIDKATDTDSDYASDEFYDLDEHTATYDNYDDTQSNAAQASTLDIAKSSKNSKLRVFFDFDYKNSFIFNLIVMLSAVIGKAFRNSFTVYIFTSFNKIREKFSESFIFGAFTAPKAERAANDLKKRFRRTAATAALPSAFSKFFTSLMRLKTRIYGCILFAFGVTALVAHFFVAELYSLFTVNEYNPITAIILIVAAIFLIACSKTFSETIKDSVVLSTLLFNFLGVTRPPYTDEDEIYFPASGAFVIGFFMGALTLFFPAHLVIGVVFTAIFTYIVVKFPETGVISLILIAPFIYNTALLYISSIITLSYVFKIFTGKRTANFEFSDIFIGIFLAVMFLSELVTFGGESGSFMYTAFVLVYFMCVIALKDNVWFERAINSIVLASCLFGAYSLFTTLLGRTISLDIEFIANTDLGDPEKTVISSTAILSLFLMCGIIFILAALFDSKSKSKRFVCVLLIIVSFVYLFLESSPAVIVAAIISTVVYLIIISSKTLIFVIAAAVIIPIVGLFAPDIYSAVNNLVENESYRLDVYSAVVNMLTRYGFTGIGMSSNAFSELYATYYVGNTVSVNHAHSFIFQIAISLGVPGLILLFIILFFCFQGAFSYGRDTTDKRSKNRLFCYAGMCSVLALMICGTTEHIAYNPRIFLLLWFMLGLTVCARRSAKDATGSLGAMMDYDENYNG